VKYSRRVLTDKRSQPRISWGGHLIDEGIRHTTRDAILAHKKVAYRSSSSATAKIVRVDPEELGL
jgi:hypothetical protein